MGASAKQQPQGTITPQANVGIDKKLRTLDRVKSNKVIETTLEVDKEHKDSDEDSSGEGQDDDEETETNKDGGNSISMSQSEQSIVQPRFRGGKEQILKLDWFDVEARMKKIC